jgi:hypothetical protein
VPFRFEEDQQNKEIDRLEREDGVYVIFSGHAMVYEILV